MAERQLGESQAADELAASVRRLMRAAATSSCSDADLRHLGSQLDVISAALEPQANTAVRRIPLEEGPIAKIRDGQSMRMFPFNPLGIPQSIQVEDGVGRSVVELGPLHEGPPGLLHGGFSAAILDALIGVVVMVEVAPSYSAQLDVSFRHAVPLHGVVETEAWVTDVGPRRILAEGTISHAGRVAVSARGVFVPVSQPRGRTDGSQSG